MDNACDCLREKGLIKRHMDEIGNDKNAWKDFVSEPGRGCVRLGMNPD